MGAKASCLNDTGAEVVDEVTSSRPDSYIYLDNNASTPVDPRVLEAMRPTLEGNVYANPSAIGHPMGREAKALVEKARAQVAALINCEPDEVVFTSGATESNGLCILGVMEHLDRDETYHLITSLLEHSCVLNAAKKCETDPSGRFDVTFLGVPPDGVTRAQAVSDAFKPNTTLVSIMLANNEIGVINDIQGIGRACNKEGVLFHVDASQGFGKIPFDVKKLGVDFASLAGHKLYAPKGVGVLYVKQQARKFLEPIFRGGGQEGGLRGGTHNLPGIVGMGEACEIARLEMAEEAVRLKRQRDELLGILKAGVAELQVNGSMESRVPNNLNVSFPGCDGEALVIAVSKHMAITSGSACTAAQGAVSHVMAALGVPDEVARATLRFGVGRFTTDEEVRRAGQIVVDIVREIYRPAPKPSPSGDSRAFNARRSLMILEAETTGEDRPKAARLLRRQTTRKDIKEYKGVKAEVRTCASSLDADRNARLKQGGLTVVARVENSEPVPRYINWRVVESYVRVEPTWLDALGGLSTYSHLLIVWMMDQAEHAKASHVPQGAYADVPKVGIFACRCPERPNPIAVSVAVLLRVDADGFLVRGLDATTGSAILDIKPYYPDYDDPKVLFPDDKLVVPDWTSKLKY